MALIVRLPASKVPFRTNPALIWPQLQPGDGEHPAKRRCHARLPGLVGHLAGAGPCRPHRLEPCVLLGGEVHPNDERRGCLFVIAQVLKNALHCCPLTYHTAATRLKLFPTVFSLAPAAAWCHAPSMSAKRTMRESQKDAIRQKALARHAERKLAAEQAIIMPPDPPAPTPVVVPEPVGVPAVTPKEPFTQRVSSPPVPSPEFAAALTPPTPRAAFTSWLRSPAGLNAADPRLSSDRVRMAAELEDRLLAAFTAGLNSVTP